MNIIIRKNILLYILLLFFFFKCAYFNTFYNAEQSFKKAIEIIENSPILDNGKFPSEAIKFLDKTIKNCNIVIEDYPDSKYIDKAHLLLGISFFYKQRYDASINEFNIIIDSNDYEIKNKAILWSAYSFLKLNEIEKTENYLEKISLDNLNKDNLYIYYNIRAENDENSQDLDGVYKHYLLASDITSKSSRKNYIYNKLIKISEESNNLLLKTEFIESLEKYTDDSNKLKDLKIEWIESKNKLGQYEDIISEIDLIIDDPLFLSIKAQLMIYKAKAYRNSGNNIAAKEILNDIISSFSRKNETSEAYYIMGSLSLFEDFNLEESKALFQKSIDERSRSEYAKKSKTLKEKINNYEQLKEDFEYFKNNSFNNDSIDYNEPKNSMDIKLPDIDDSILIDSILFEIGQIFYFEFNQLDSALNRYQYILDKFPNSRYNRQLSNIIKYHQSSDSLKMYEVDNNLDSNDVLSDKRDQAWNYSDMNEMLNFFNSIYVEYSDSISLFNVAYIYDHFFYNLKEAVPIYYDIQKTYPTHPKIAHINNRLKELDLSIGTIIDESNQKIEFYDAYNLIQDYELDSARKVLQSLEVSRKTPMYQSVRDLILNIDYYNKMLSKYDNNITNDSIIYHMAKIDYYYFNKVEKSLLEFEKIINKFPNSEYFNQSLWILSNNLDRYASDSIDYQLVDTLIISFYNPIKNWDIQKIKDDYKKLNDLYMIFETED